MIDIQNEIEKTIRSHGRICQEELWEHLVAILRSGKKLRPNFVLLLWERIVPDQEVPQELIDDLVALELIHTSTLIHDDIIDEGQFRRNVPTLNHTDGNEISLLMGNLVKDLALKTGHPRSLRTLNDASFDVNLGQLWETLARSHKTIDVNHYLSIVLYKTSRIFSHCADLFSSYSHISFSAVEKSFIVAMAVLYQIADDLIDSLVSCPKDKSIGQDKKNNVHSFVVASFQDTPEIAASDGIEYADEILFLRNYLDEVRKGYAFQCKLEELPPEKQKQYLADLSSLLKSALHEQPVNVDLAAVLTLYFDKIEQSISRMQIQ